MIDADHLADEIVSCGTKEIFGVLGGGSSLQLIDALLSRGLRFQPTHFEGTAAIMAGTLGRLTGRAGTVISIKGPGLANMLPGLAVCKFENFPTVALAESYDSESFDSSAHKKIDHYKLTQTVVKSCRYLLPEGGKNYSRCFELANRETPAPVLLNLAKGESAIQNGSDNNTTVGFTSVSELMATLNRSTHPIVILGSIASRLPLGPMLKNLQIPVFTTVAAKGVLNEEAPQSAGIFTGAGGEKTPESHLIPQSDLVVGVGLRGNEILGTQLITSPIINLEFTPIVRNDGLEIGKIASLDHLELVLSELSVHSWGIDECRGLVMRLRGDLIESGFLPAYVFNSLCEKFPNNVRIVLDTGDFCTIAEHVWPSCGLDFLGASNSRYMGAGMPMALAASIYDQSIPTILAVGDGGIGMYIADVKIAVERKLPLLVMFLTDGGYGSIKHSAVAQRIDPSLLEISNPSWIRVIENFGIESYQVSNTQSFNDALERWSQEDGPMFMECIFNPTKYSEMTKGVR